LSTATLIQQAESSPDTTLTLVTGGKIVVCESTAEVIGLTVAYRARLMGEAAKHCPGGLLLASGSVLRALAAETARGTLDEIEPDSAGLAQAQNRKVEPRVRG